MVQVGVCNDEFTALMLDLLAKLNDSQVGSSSRYVNLVHRLNFNSFYSDKMESVAMLTTTS